MESDNIVLTKKKVKDNTPKKKVKNPLGIMDMFANKEEKLIAVGIINRYLSEYEIETPADKMLIKQLVNLEVIQARLQRQMNETNSLTSSVQSKTLDTLHKNLSKIIDITEKLGITKEKRDASKTDGFVAWESLVEKARKWGNKNQLSRTSKCPHCQKYILWKRRTESWELLNHPYLEDSLLINYPLLKLVGDEIITPSDYVNVMGTSEDFFYWLIPKLNIDKRKECNLDKFIAKGTDGN